MGRPFVRDWEKDLVYLIQFPRAGSVPSLSPFALKMETWLRMADIPYKNVSNEFKYESVRNQIPFVELNGRQISDTEVIIQELTRIFNIKMDEHLNELAAAEATAFHSLIEDRLRWYCWYYRALNNTFIATSDGVIGHFEGVQRLIFKEVVVKWMKYKLSRKCQSHGVGKLMPSEVDGFVKRDLKAVSTFLVDKRYLMGENFCSLDATAFGHLTMFYFCLMNSEIKQFMISDCKNIIDYLNNVKAEFWPDWDEATSTLSLNTKRTKLTNSQQQQQPFDELPTEPASEPPGTVPNNVHQQQEDEQNQNQQSTAEENHAPAEPAAEIATANNLHLVVETEERNNNAEEVPLQAGTADGTNQ